MFYYLCYLLKCIFNSSFLGQLCHVFSRLHCQLACLFHVLARNLFSNVSLSSSHLKFEDAAETEIASASSLWLADRRPTESPTRLKSHSRCLAKPRNKNRKKRIPLNQLHTSFSAGSTNISIIIINYIYIDYIL